MNGGQAKREGGTNGDQTRGELQGTRVDLTQMRGGGELKVDWTNRGKVMVTGHQTRRGGLGDTRMDWGIQTKQH